MKIAEIFETRVEEKIDPVIKVSEVQDEAKLAAEIGSYVVTPLIERYIDDFLEHFTDTFRRDTTDIGAWISGYFGSGKSHLSKILAFLAEDRTLNGQTAAKRFEARVPVGSARRSSILKSLPLLGNCETRVLAFNLNTIVDSGTTPLSRLLLGQYYQSNGYSKNVIYARVIERELDRRGKLDALHSEVSNLASRPWDEVRNNPGFYARYLYQAASNLVPDLFPSAQDVTSALKEAERGEQYHAKFLVETMLEDLKRREAAIKKPCRFLFVLDESGQWIGDDGARLAQLQALVEEAATKGQGKIWIFVTTHEDMGSVIQGALGLRADMKKIEDRFRFKFSLTTENIELVLEDRVLKKKIAGADAIRALFDSAPAAIQGLGELVNVEGRQLRGCTRESFVNFYPFFPYQVHLIPEIVKGLRARGGRSEQLSGSTRTLLAITQDILRAGRRPYLNLVVGEVVSFDEVYYNLSGEGEVSSDIRKGLSQIEQVVTGATPLTRRVAEILFLVDDLKYIPRTLDNLARMLVENGSDELPALRSLIEPELERLTKARMVTRIGDEYEFLTGERRSFEDEVAAVGAELRYQDREAGLARHFVFDADTKKSHLVYLLGFDNVLFKGAEFPVRLSMDGTFATREGDVEVRISSPLAAFGGLKIADLEDQSRRPEEKNTIFVLSDRVLGFDQQLNRYLAMREVVNKWKGDSSKSGAARDLALDRESNDLGKLARAVQEDLKQSLKRGHVIFRGFSRSIGGKPGQTPGETLRAELVGFLSSVYPQFDKLPVRITREQSAIIEVLTGEKNLSHEVRDLKLFDSGGALDLRSALVDGLRIFLSSRKERGERTLGSDLLREFGGPPYGWDRNAVRVGVAASIRAGLIKPVINKMPRPNTADPVLQKALRDSREFDRIEIVLEEADIDQAALEEVRGFLIKLTGNRKIEETPAALHEAMEQFGREELRKADRVAEWSDAAGFPRPTGFESGRETLREILTLTTPAHRVTQIRAKGRDLLEGVEAIDELWNFHEKWRSQFVSTKGLAEQLRSVEHLLPTDGPIRNFLDAYRTASEGARFAQPEIWKAVEQARAAGSLELGALLEKWRDEARTIANEAVSRLPEDLKGNDLDPSIAPELEGPLREFIASVDGSAEPALAASLPERARKFVGNLGAAIQMRVDTIRNKERNTKEPQREVRQLRLSDLTTVRRVRSESEWDSVAKTLDARIRELLKNFDVELD
jgi:hypothetical protein